MVRDVVNFVSVFLFIAETKLGNNFGNFSITFIQNYFHRLVFIHSQDHNKFFPLANSLENCRDPNSFL